MARPKTEAADFTQTILRLPADLLEYIRDEADAKGRPVNTQFIWMLEHLRRHPVELEPPGPRRKPQELATAS